MVSKLIKTSSSVSQIFKKKKKKSEWLFLRKWLSICKKRSWQIFVFICYFINSNSTTVSNVSTQLCMCGLNQGINTIWEQPAIKCFGLKGRKAKKGRKQSVSQVQTKNVHHPQAKLQPFFKLEILNKHRRKYENKTIQFFLGYHDIFFNYSMGHEKRLGFSLPIRAWGYILS